MLLRSLSEAYDLASALAIAIAGALPVSALLSSPGAARACLVFAHGAGAGMTHPFMEAVSVGLHARRVATLRYNFPFTETGSARPDTPIRAQLTVRSAVAEAARLVPGLPLFAGGKSFGGRMTSQAQAAAPMPGIRGLVFLGFPLHPAAKPSTMRAEHLRDIDSPMLFVQGARDALAEIALIASQTTTLGAKATLHTVEGADHAFHVRKRSGRTDQEVLEQILDAIVEWIERVLAAR